MSKDEIEKNISLLNDIKNVYLENWRQIVERLHKNPNDEEVLDLALSEHNKALVIERFLSYETDLITEDDPPVRFQLP